jgi:hypothetical protein
LLRQTVYVGLREAKPAEQVRRERVKIFPPMTFANMRANGVRAVIATCEACGHKADVNVDALPENPGSRPMPAMQPAWREADQHAACMAYGEQSLRRGSRLNWLRGNGQKGRFPGRYVRLT